MSTIITWQDVAKIHGTYSGIRIKNSMVYSIIFNAGHDKRYPNTVDGKFIRYYVNTKSTAYINALMRSLDKQNPFPVFQKLAINKWKSLGFYSVDSHKGSDADYILFLLHTA
jgi:hypothetical protein